jgi:hypothetical protein
MPATSEDKDMALPLGEAGIGEIPNESAVLSAMQSSIGDKTGLYIFPGEKNLQCGAQIAAQEILTTFFACRPFGPSTTSNEARSPSDSARKPPAMIESWRTKTSAPRSRTMNRSLSFVEPLDGALFWHFQHLPWENSQPRGEDPAPW